MCKDCGQKYHQTSKEVFKNHKGKGPECPHCYLIYQKHPKTWRKKIKKLRDDKENNPHKDHNVSISKYDSNYMWCFDCHELFPTPEGVPYVETYVQGGGAGGAGYAVTSSTAFPMYTSTQYYSSSGSLSNY
jgi:hypothetical protein